MNVRALFAVCAVAVLGAVSATTPARADEWNKSYEVGATPEVAIHTDDGHVRVVVGDSRHVEVHVRTTGWHIRPGQITIAATQVGNRIEVQIREPHLRFDVFVGQRRVDVDVVVPRALTLAVQTGDGSVSLPALMGPVTVHTGDGNITADSLRGSVELSSGDGRIRVHSMDGGLLAHTADGSIVASGRFDAIDASSGDGSITVDAQPGSAVGHGWGLSTGDGSISLRVPSNLAMELSAHTGDGHIDIDIPLLVSGRMTGHEVVGSANGGGGTVRLRSGDGHISVMRL